MQRLYFINLPAFLNQVLNQLSYRFFTGYQPIFFLKTCKLVGRMYAIFFHHIIYKLPVFYYGDKYGICAGTGHCKT